MTTELQTGVAHRQLTLPGGRVIGYREWGRADGPVVIALHGLTDNSDSWRLAGPLLGERYRVIGLDARGHGDSEWTADYSIESMVEDVVAAMKVLGVIAAAVVGHSMGGLVAFLLAVSYPERVRALVLEDSPFDRADPPRPIRFGPRPGDDFDWRAEVAISRFRNDPPQEWWGWAHGITCPTLVLAGTRSHLAHAPQKRLAGLIHRGEYDTLATGHGMHLERPGAFAAVVMPFLASAIR